MEATEGFVRLHGSMAMPVAFVEMWKEEHLCDADIIVKGRTFRAHKLVLAAGSDFFRALFRCVTRFATSNYTGAIGIFACAWELLASQAHSRCSKFVVPASKLATFWL
eukprot:6188589-Pleurochrysis_carterae.AAC.1